MNITIVGTGYVGLVTGACFSEMGSHVTCVDVDKTKIENLKNGILPIYEPGLENLVIQNCKEGLLHFTTDLAEASQSSNIFFIAVGTPPGEDGSADLKYVLGVASEIGQNIDKYSVIVDKSTVPVGTADKVRATIQKELEIRGKDVEFDVVSNPEFLKEGAAVEDFLKPDRIVVGADSQKAAKIMQRLYAPFSRNRDKLIFMNVRDAEMTKYTANAMLATKISFMNEIANICEYLGVDVENVRKGIGSDRRIGYSFIYPGCGYGGSCFPKDVKALIRTSRDTGFEPELLASVEKRNMIQKKAMIEKVVRRFGTNLSGMTFAIWGLSFKPGTDDMREAPSVVVINSLIEMGATIHAYDPVAMEQARKEFPENLFSTKKIELFNSPYDALDNCDAMILVTEWKAFRQLRFSIMVEKMKQKVIFDGRNLYDPEEARENGFEYHGVGRELKFS
ncbi:UDP-glucose 6-dehydrogenase [Desulfamplus magnetovallimortis]|uniref:UDP-glucose 6-dehydrogenase n=1 Tax=Desulfamplus magnetovallimortis TaxID=1246637 RepID=A0A1W1HCB7_9BACT|nr:UDP-glucose/GDP-mannose dehydrogenase family protein [Desulfamplus magnetovallimortis]SLM30042.1 UDP-glucose 6-dehydrogenase [Desulfamplus magnetovallimortis]